ncbi:MAG: PAS domain S-box protein, partial [Bacteroidota bacterium]
MHTSNNQSQYPVIDNDDYSLKQLVSVIDEFEDYIFLRLDETGDIISCNKATEKITGYTSLEVTGKSFRIFYSDTDKSQNLLSLALQSGRSVYEGVFLRKDESEFPGSVVITALPGDHNQPLSFLVVIKDLTDKKNAEQFRLIYLQQLENSKLEMEQLAHAASHDLLAPLRTIKSFFELFHSKFQDNTDQDDKRFIAIIEESASRMKEMLKGISDYARIGMKDEISRIDCNKIVEEVIYTLREEVNSVGVSVYYKELPVVTGYASDLRTLFQVLISNAIKFRRPGTKPVIEISAASNNNGWSFSIKDNGIGIEKIYLDKLFRFFQRLH